jgi:amidase
LGGGRDAAGATIEEISPPVLSETDPLYQQTLAGVTAAFQPPQAMDFYEGMIARADPADTNPMTQWARWNLQTVRDWSFAREARAQLKASCVEFFNQYDALLCPVSNVPAISHDDSPEPSRRTILVNGQSTPYLSQSIWSGLATVAGLTARRCPGRNNDQQSADRRSSRRPLLEDRTATDVGRHIERLVGRLTRN